MHASNDSVWKLGLTHTVSQSVLRICSKLVQSSLRKHKTDDRQVQNSSFEILLGILKLSLGWAQVQNRCAQFPMSVMAHIVLAQGRVSEHSFSTYILPRVQYWENPLAYDRIDM